MPDIDVPNKQRALVFQGSVALGAFEAGVFKRLYEIIKVQDPNWEKRMFDIVAGTSAGAINAANSTSHVKESRTWEGSAKKLVEYWKHHLSSSTPAITYQGLHWWDEYYQWWGKYYDKTSSSGDSSRMWLQRKRQGDIILQSIFLQMVPQTYFLRLFRFHSQIVNFLTTIHYFHQPISGFATATSP